AFVPDQQDLVILGSEPARLIVHLGDQRAGGVDRPQPALPGGLVHTRRDAVGGEHNQSALWDLVGFLYEDRAALLERPHYVRVVHDLLADINRGAELVEHALDGLDRAVHARAITARLGKQDALGFGHGIHGRRTPSAPRGPVGRNACRAV